MSHHWVLVLLACFLTKIDGSTVFEVLAKVVNLCHLKNNTNLLVCVKERCLVALDNVYRSDQEISLVPDWISLVRTEELPIQERTGKIFLADMENQSPENKSIIVDNLIVRRIIDFLESRAISVKIPIVALDVFNILEEDEREGRGKQSYRGKKDKGGSMLVMGGLFAGTMMAMKLAAVAAMAGKALMASMMATLLAALAALSKKGSSHGSYEVINVPPGHHARRSMYETGYSHQRYPSTDSYVEPLDFEQN